MFRAVIRRTVEGVDATEDREEARGMQPDDALEGALMAQVAGLRRYARALVGNSTDAEDLVQEALARALGRLRPWRPVRDLRAYLFTVLHNLYVDEYRSRRAAPTTVDIDNVLHHPAAPPDQDHRLELRDLARGLALLPVEQREVVLLVGLEGLTYVEVARVLDIPIGTVMSRLSRARRHLRELVEARRMPAPAALRKPS
jgi:RNA polymerase sigma-70 factor (ECF subfamily)